MNDNTMQKNNNDINKIKVVMDGLKPHYRMGCLIILIMMVMYLILL